MVAQAGGDGSGARGTLDPTSPAGRAQAALPERTEQTGDTKFRFRLAPIRWGGTIADAIAVYDSPGSRNTRHTQNAMLRAASYVWQPWFAQVSGNLTFSTTKNSQSGGGESSNGNRDSSITGGGVLSLFPVSRFPFTASFDVADTRTATANPLYGGSQRSTRFGVRQSYTPLQGWMSASGGFDTSRVDVPGGGQDVVNNYTASYSMPIGTTQNLSLTGTGYDSKPGSTQGVAGNDSRTLNLNAYHSWRPEDNLAVNTNALLTDSVQRFESADGSRSDSTFSTLQANSTLTWRPEEESPWYVSGNASLFEVNSDFNGENNRFGSVSASGSVTYAYNRNLSLFGSLGLTQTHGTDTSELITTESGNASYTGDFLQIWGGNYGWFAGLGFMNQTGGIRGGVQSTGNASHNFVRPLYQDPIWGLSMNLSQGVSLTTGGITGTSETLTHSAGLNLVINQSESAAMAFYLLGSDFHTFGENEGSGQQLNLTASGNLILSRYSTFSANFAVNFTRQVDPTSETAQRMGGDTTSTRGSASGSATYQHARAFNIPRLRYTATFMANTLLLNSRYQGNVNAATDANQTTYTLDQRLDYRIGRLDFQSNLQWNRYSGNSNSMIFFFRVSRDFGAF